MAYKGLFPPQLLLLSLLPAMPCAKPSAVEPGSYAGAEPKETAILSVVDIGNFVLATRKGLRRLL